MSSPPRSNGVGSQPGQPSSKGKAASRTDLESLLHSFREKWREEVRGKKKQPPAAAGPSAPPPPAEPPKPEHVTPLETPLGLRPYMPRAPGVQSIHDRYDGPHHHPQTYDGPSEPTEKVAPVERLPVTAMDHYKLAVEKESQGILGESLRLYRQAFRVGHHSLSICQQEKPC